MGLSGTVEIINSPLSELSVLGFELGYSIQRSNDTLTLFDTHNGDFLNNAQMYLDNYISEGEVKWFRQTPLTILLPVGQTACNGPEHSDTRLLRLLMLNDEEADESWREWGRALRKSNIFVCSVTTPANYFALIRRQMHLYIPYDNYTQTEGEGEGEGEYYYSAQHFRKPLFLLLSHRLIHDEYSLSPLQHLVDHPFHPVLLDPYPPSPPSNIKRILFCSGQVSVGLFDYRNTFNNHNVTIIRLEQLAPFPFAEIESVLQSILSVSDNSTDIEIVWVQEEPRNMGAYNWVVHRFAHIFSKLSISTSLFYLGHRTRAAPETGYCTLALNEEMQFFVKAFTWPLQRV